MCSISSSRVKYPEVISSPADDKKVSIFDPANGCALLLSYTDLLHLCEGGGRFPWLLVQHLQVHNDVHGIDAIIHAHLGVEHAIPL